MGTSADGRGRIYLPKEIRERFGDEYRIVELPNRVVLLPVADDPQADLREAVGDAFEGTDRESLRTAAREKAVADLREEASKRDELSDGTDGGA